MHFAGLMSVGKPPDAAGLCACSHVQRGLVVQGLKRTYQIDVPARTLSAVLDEAGVQREIDLLSLDIEGAELEALRGLDWERHAPRFLCIEVRQRELIDNLLAVRYDVAEVLNANVEYADILFRRK